MEHTELPDKIFDKLIDYINSQKENWGKGNLDMRFIIDRIDMGFSHDRYRLIIGYDDLIIVNFSQTKMNIYNPNVKQLIELHDYFYLHYGYPGGTKRPSIHEKIFNE